MELRYHPRWLPKENSSKMKESQRIPKEFQRIPKNSQEFLNSSRIPKNAIPIWLWIIIKKNPSFWLLEYLLWSLFNILIFVHIHKNSQKSFNQTRYSDIHTDKTQFISTQLVFYRGGRGTKIQRIQKSKFGIGILVVFERIFFVKWFIQETSTCDTQNFWPQFLAWWAYFRFFDFFFKTIYETFNKTFFMA